MNLKKSGKLGLYQVCEISFPQKADMNPCYPNVFLRYTQIPEKLEFDFRCLAIFTDIKEPDDFSRYLKFPYERMRNDQAA